jgi:CRP/FNR family transcriptional regulator
MVTHDPLDLRNLPVWERASTVLEESAKLGTGDSLEFLTEVDPRALIARIEQLHPDEFAFEPRHLGGNEWRVRLTRSYFDAHASSLAAAMRRSPVFSTLDENARAQLMESVSEHTARKGQIICAENAACTYLALIVEGAMAVFVGAGSRERLLFHLSPFDTFGETEFFDGGLSVGRTVVLSKTARYATIPFNVLRDVATRHPSFMTTLAATISQRNRTLASELAAQVSQPIIARVAAALLPYAAPERQLHPALPPLPTMTQAQIAAAAGTVKEVAARAIAELERVQALRRERGHIRYLDRSKLLSMIDQAP